MTETKKEKADRIEDEKVEAEFFAAAAGASTADTKAENHVMGSGESPSDPKKGQEIGKAQAHAKVDTKANAQPSPPADMKVFDKAVSEVGPTTQDKVAPKTIEELRTVAKASRVRDEENEAAGKREKAQIIVDSADASKTDILEATDHSLETSVLGMDRDTKKALRVLAKLGTNEDPNVMNTVGFKNSKK